MSDDAVGTPCGISSIAVGIAVTGDGIGGAAGMIDGSIGRVGNAAVGAKDVGIAGIGAPDPPAGLPGGLTGGLDVPSDDAGGAGVGGFGCFAVIGDCCGWVGRRI